MSGIIGLLCMNTAVFNNFMYSNKTKHIMKIVIVSKLYQVFRIINNILVNHAHNFIFSYL